MYNKIEQELGRKIPEALKKLSGGKWKWGPRIGERYLEKSDSWNQEHLICPHNFDALKPHYEKLLPLLHWERQLEPILEGMGYYLRVDSFPRDHIHVCRIMSSYTSKQICSAEAKKRQEAVQRAILALAKEKEK